MSKTKLIREIDGHKFYSVSYINKSVCAAYARPGFVPVYEDERWWNYTTGLGFQEDVHERPFTSKGVK